MLNLSRNGKVLCYSDTYIVMREIDCKMMLFCNPWNRVTGAYVIEEMEDCLGERECQLPAKIHASSHCKHASVPNCSFIVYSVLSLNASYQ